MEDADPSSRLRALLAAQGSLQLALKALPRSVRTEWAPPLADGTLRLRVAAVPEGGKANAEILRFLARELRVALDQVRLVSGASGTRKVVKVG